MNAYQSGTYIQHYRLNHVIGAGGFGTIYHATDERYNCDVAVKLINADSANQTKFIQQFEMEAQILAQLDHEHIVSFYDYANTPDGAYLVMDWIDGESLCHYLKHNQLTLSEILRLIKQLASALNYIHQHGIVHRDIKPSNILIDKHQNLILVDFGIAVDLKLGEPDTPSFILGSPAYLAPEQIVSNQIIPQGDIYSLGIILYELLTQDHPFRADSVKEILEMQVLNPMPSIRGFRPDLPTSVDMVIWKATAKRPENRYNTVMELVDAIEFAIGNLPNEPWKSPAIQLNPVFNSGIHTEIINIPA